MIPYSVLRIGHCTKSLNKVMSKLMTKDPNFKMQNINSVGSVLRTKNARFNETVKIKILRAKQAQCLMSILWIYIIGMYTTKIKLACNSRQNGLL